MKEVETIELEGEKYIIVSELKINNIPYMHLASIQDPSNFCIRKVVIKNGEEILTGLDDRSEFEMALKYFSEKHSKDLEN